MSNECARGFLLRMKSDLEFFFQVAAIEDVDERVAFIRAQGFDCTAQEISDSFAAPHELPPEVDRRTWRKQLPPDPDFSCAGERIGNAGVITVTGELDLATSGTLRETADRLRYQSIVDHLVVDLTGCSFIDSAGITVLIETQRAIESPLIVACHAQQVLRALEITGLATVFVIREDREAALAELETRLEAS